MIHKSSKLMPEAPKSDAKIEQEIGHQQNEETSSLGGNMVQNTLPKWTATADLSASCLAPASKLPLGGPWAPANHNKLKLNETQLLCHVCFALPHLLQHTFCLAGRVHSESHCHHFRLELYLPSLGNVKSSLNTRRLLGLFGGAAMTRYKRLR